jgi:predicted membrane channel-forming protein YqfA (hemolysin III family)
MEAVAVIMVGWIIFVVGAIIYTNKYEKTETRLAKTTHRKHYG